MAFDPENPYALTVVEQQVVDLLIAGLTGDEVGDLLNIDRRGVALRRASAMRKYGARNGLHLAHLVEITRQKAGNPADTIAIEDVPASFTDWSRLADGKPA
jgi:DNA-binding CsgD family transcriptional regulator